MSCYIIYHYNIIDSERIELLGPLSQPIVEQYCGELVIANPAMFWREALLTVIWLCMNLTLLRPRKLFIMLQRAVS